jgi:hypothetical protein
LGNNIKRNYEGIVCEGVGRIPTAQQRNRTSGGIGERRKEPSVSIKNWVTISFSRMILALWTYYLTLTLNPPTAIIV